MRRVILLGFLIAWAVPLGAVAQPLYDRYCVGCHGGDGDGRGPAASLTWGRPADLRKGTFKFRTSVGEASDDDLKRTIRNGVAGTSMPAFAFSDAQLAEVVAAVRAFGPRARPGAKLVLGAPPVIDAARGAALWTASGCATCHGADGRGAGERPHDLTVLHRPVDGELRAATAMSIATGLAGTAMPSYADAAKPDELWWLADRVLELARGRRDRSRLDPAVIAADHTEVGTAPGGMFEVQPLPPQGPVPSSLAPAQASLAPRQCARCHAKQYREWSGSVHARAMSPGVVAQIDYGMADAVACRRCHAPLAEQVRGPLRDEGVLCAGCHVRQWERHGPPNVAPSLLTVPAYPLVTDAVYERSDFCMPCHQLPARTALAGRPLLNTYQEWLEGPYQPRGVQCQHCHMANREHEVRGIHDRETVRQGLELRAHASRERGGIVAVAELTNIGAGHYLPTTTTPALWLRLELLRAGVVVGLAEQRIGRDLTFDTEFHERADTRIPPGAHAWLGRRWAVDGDSVRVTVEVHPDDYYEGFYRKALTETLAPAQRALFEQALARALGSHYLAEQRTLRIGDASQSINRGDPILSRP